MLFCFYLCLAACCCCCICLNHVFWHNHNNYYVAVPVAKNWKHSSAQLQCETPSVSAAADAKLSFFFVAVVLFHFVLLLMIVQIFAVRSKLMNAFTVYLRLAYSYFEIESTRGHREWIRFWSKSHIMPLVKHFVRWQWIDCIINYLLASIQR